MCFPIRVISELTLKRQRTVASPTQETLRSLKCSIWLISGNVPERITLSLKIEDSGDNAEKVAIKSELQKVAIIEYLTENVTAKAVEVEELLGVRKSRTWNL